MTEVEEKTGRREEALRALAKAKEQEARLRGEGKLHTVPINSYTYGAMTTTARFRDIVKADNTTEMLLRRVYGLKEDARVEALTGRLLEEIVSLPDLTSPVLAEWWVKKELSGEVGRYTLTREKLYEMLKGIAGREITDHCPCNVFCFQLSRLRGANGILLPPEVRNYAMRRRKSDMD